LWLHSWAKIPPDIYKKNTNVDEMGKIEDELEFKIV
jgi:hypothetical protein